MARDGVYLIEPDTHRPFHDLRFESLIYQFIKLLRPVGYINLGDFVDFWQLSSYDKDPARKDDILDDLASFNSHLDRVEKVLPRGAAVHLLCGNHEDRLRRYIWQNAKALAGIVPAFPSLLRLTERISAGKHAFHWHPIERWNSCRIGDTVIHHGFYFDRNTATQNLVRYRGVNFIQGHTHRVQYAHNDKFWSLTAGHGSDESKTAHKPAPNDWQKAITVLTLHRGRGTVEIVPVHNGTCMFRGQHLKG